MDRGFSLIEVLVALLIASLVAGALAGSTRASLHGAAAAEHREHAARLASEALEELLSVTPEDLEVLDEETTIGAGGERLFRRRTIEPGPTQGTWHLRVRVRSEHSGATADLATLRRTKWIRP